MHKIFHGDLQEKGAEQRQEVNKPVAEIMKKQGILFTSAIIACLNGFYN